MTAPDPEIVRLREAFASLADTQSAAADVDTEKIWHAVQGELAADEVEELLVQAARCPQTAEAWRLARAYRDELETAGETTDIHRPRQWRWIAGLAAAAAVIIGVALPLFFPDFISPTAFYRGTSSENISSLVADEQVLPRDHFLLSWSPGPEGCTYDLHIADESLNPLAEAHGLTEAHYLVPAENLRSVADRGLVLWRVHVSISGGQSVASPTFRQRVGR